MTDDTERDDGGPDDNLTATRLEVGEVRDRGDVVEIPIVEEELVVTKRPVVKEVIRVKKRTVTEQVEVKDRVRKEDVEEVEGWDGS